MHAVRPHRAAGPGWVEDATPSTQPGHLVSLEAHLPNEIIGRAKVRGVGVVTGRSFEFQMVGGAVLTGAGRDSRRRRLADPRLQREVDKDKGVENLHRRFPPRCRFEDRLRFLAIKLG